jgi:predicted transcriptional regulator
VPAGILETKLVSDEAKSRLDEMARQTRSLMGF